MSFEIRPLKESEFPRWDAFVEESPGGTLFHNTFWLKASGRKFVIYGYFKGGELFAGIPLAYETMLGLKIVNQPPLTPYLGVVFKKRDSKYVNRISEEKAINSEIARRLRKDFGSGILHFTPGAKDLQPFIWEGFSPGIRYTYINNLTDGLEGLWQSMNDKRRNDIRKAEADGIEVIATDDFEKVYSLVEKTFSRQEKAVAFKSAAFRYDMALKERKQCRGFLAGNKDGEAVAVVYIVWDSKRSYYLLGGYDPERSHHGASALAMWQAIKFTREELGLGEFDFEGSMVPRIEQFFRKFGGVLTPYYTVSWAKPFLKVVPKFVRNVAVSLLAHLV